MRLTLEFSSVGVLLSPSRMDWFLPPIYRQAPSLQLEPEHTLMLIARSTGGIRHMAWDRYGSDLDPFVQSGRVWHQGGHFGLTREGMLVANEILAVFV